MLRLYVVKLTGGIRDNCEILRVSNKTSRRIERERNNAEKKRERDRKRPPVGHTRCPTQNYARRRVNFMYAGLVSLLVFALLNLTIATNCTR